MNRADRLAGAAAGARGEEGDLGKRAGRAEVPLLDDPLLGLLEQALAPLADALPEEVAAVAAYTEEVAQVDRHGGKLAEQRPDLLGQPGDDSVADERDVGVRPGFLVGGSGVARLNHQGAAPGLEVEEGAEAALAPGVPDQPVAAGVLDEEAQRDRVAHRLVVARREHRPPHLLE